MGKGEIQGARKFGVRGAQNNFHRDFKVIKKFPLFLFPPLRVDGYVVKTVCFILPLHWRMYASVQGIITKKF